MNIKVIFAALFVLVVGFIGYNSYSSSQNNKYVEARTAGTELAQANLAQIEEDKQKQIQINQQQAELEAMPQKAQDIIAAKALEQQPDTGYKNINLEKEDRAKLDEVVSRWDDASAVASRTSRIALSAVVKDMQSLKREFDKLNVTSCLVKAQVNMSVVMESEIAMYLRFMANSKADLTGDMMASDMMDKSKGQEQYYLIVKKCTD